MVSNEPRLLSQSRRIAESGNAKSEDRIDRLSNIEMEIITIRLTDQAFSALGARR